MRLALLTLALATTAAAQPRTAVVDPAASTLAYTGHHPTHDWTGTSRQVSGTVTLDPAAPERSRVVLAVPAASFDSGNGSRDAKMRRIVEAETYPEVRFTSTSVAVERWDRTASGYSGAWRVRGRLSFHGRTHAVEIPVQVRVAGRRVEATGAFAVSLDRFEVERPRLVVRIGRTIDLAATIQAAFPAATPDP